MEDLSKFKKLFRELMSKNSDSILKPEEIYFDSLLIDVIERVGNHVVFLN